MLPRGLRQEAHTAVPSRGTVNLAISLAIFVVVVVNAMAVFGVGIVNANARVVVVREHFSGLLVSARQHFEFPSGL